MVNRNSARHLLFVVSILLLGFVFVGYRLRRPTPLPENGVVAETATDVDYAALGATDADTATTTADLSGITPPGATGTSLAPPATMPGVQSEEEDSQEWVPSLRNESATTSADSSPQTRSTQDATDTSALAGSITGLIPAPPGSAVSGLRPDDGDTASTAEDESLASSMPPGFSLRPVTDSSQTTATGGIEQMSPPPVSRPPGGDDSTLDSSASSFDPSGKTPTHSATRPGLAPPPSYRDVPSRNDEALADNSRSETFTPSATAPLRRPAADGDDGDALPLSSESLRIYVIRPGDTLSSIAARELGSASLADNIFFSNRTVISNPDQLMVGMKIYLPIRDQIADLTEESAPSTAGAPVQRKPNLGLGAVHRVVRGDTLSSIAEEYYGTSTAWRFLFEANRNILPNPDRLSLGMELVIPPYEDK